ncbi:MULTISPECIES: hypothetical protein [unclassified Halomonas]|uniref:hypothetical protein n=1 Tax=unclassified Halomonas TaxID=2609666 RepID=UPI004033A4DF
MKKLTFAFVAALSVSTNAHGISDEDDRELWQTVFDTLPAHGWSWNDKCESVGMKVHTISTVRDSGAFTPNQIFDMMYSYSSHPHSEFGLTLLIGLAYENRHTSPSELARQADIECRNAQ